VQVARPPAARTTADSGFPDAVRAYLSPHHPIPDPPVIAIALDPSALPIAVAGRGPTALRRFLALRSAGATHLLLFSDQPDPDLASAAGKNLRHHLPTQSDLSALRALWITGLPTDRSAELAALARAAQILVNVEDQPALCDFHNVAEIRRGDLLLTVSTAGASPGLAARIRARLAADYGPEWADRLNLFRDHRATWRRAGRQPAEVTALTDSLLHANGWLA
jgi:precorrin-2 dehydrogenase / sirohydrochlorin ferrochelatase